MKKLLFSCIILVNLILTSCGNQANGELVGTFREPFFQEDPYGMLFIPLGAFHMGPSDQDINYSLNAQKKVVSVQSFYMDETEITNDEYRQFVNHVRDSLGLTVMGENEPEKFLFDEGEYEQRLNWDREVPWEDEEYIDDLATLFLEEGDERFYRRKQLDTRKLNFEYWWIDFKGAAAKTNRYSYDNIKDAQLGSKSWSYGNGIKDRGDFIMREVINLSRYISLGT